jgi:hypothetical protein
LGDCFPSQEKEKKGKERGGGGEEIKKGKNVLNLKKITVG